jgi:hypothetical protein
MRPTTLTQQATLTLIRQTLAATVQEKVALNTAKG